MCYIAGSLSRKSLRSNGDFFVWRGQYMAADELKWRLTAIFSADAEGYSRLMHETFPYPYWRQKYRCIFCSFCWIIRVKIFSHRVISPIDEYPTCQIGYTCLLQKASKTHNCARPIDSPSDCTRSGKPGKAYAKNLTCDGSRSPSGTQVWTPWSGKR